MREDTGSIALVAGAQPALAAAALRTGSSRLRPAGSSERDTVVAPAAVVAAAAVGALRIAQMRARALGSVAHYMPRWSSDTSYLLDKYAKVIVVWDPPI